MIQSFNHLIKLSFGFYNYRKNFIFDFHDTLFRRRKSRRLYFSQSTHALAHKNKPPRIIENLRKPNTLRELAPKGLWACSRGVVSKLPKGVGPAGEEC